MKLEWLESFTAFAEAMNFTHAAERLHISQPALHVQIRKLAEHLGKRLYLRQGRNLELTPDGIRCLAFARELTRRVHDFPAELRAGAPARSIVLCAGEGAYLYLLGDAIRTFSRGRTASLELLTGDRKSTLDSVLSGRADLGVTALDRPAEGLESTLVTEVEHVLVMPKEHRLARRRSISITDLRGEQIIVPPVGRPLRNTLDAVLSSQETAWDIAVECVGWELMVHFVRLGIGVAVVNACCKIPGQLRAKPIQGLPKVSYYLLHRGDELLPRVQKLAAAIVELGDKWRGRTTR